MSQLGAMPQSERWMQTWPQTMAKGPVRFISPYVVGIVSVMVLGHLVLGLMRSGPIWRDAGHVLSQTAVQVMIGIALGLSQWIRANRLYADKTGDARARYWAERHYELPAVVWMSLVVALAVVMTVVTSVMAWTWAEPALWAIALLCAALGALVVFALPQVRASATTDSHPHQVR